MAKTHAERMHGRMLAVAEGELINRHNGCDWWIRRYLANHFGTAPNGAYAAAMAAVRLRRGYGTDSHRFEDGSGALWTWDEDGKGDLLTVWDARADMDGEIDDAVAVVTRELSAFNGFWGWEMERQDRLGKGDKEFKLVLEDVEKVIAIGEVAIADGNWLDIFSQPWKTDHADRAVRAQIAYEKTQETIMILSCISVPNPVPPEAEAVCEYKKLFAPPPPPPDYAPEVKKVHKIVAERLAQLHYAEYLLGRLGYLEQVGGQHHSENRMGQYLSHMVAMGVGRP